MWPSFNGGKATDEYVECLINVHHADPEHLPVGSKPRFAAGYHLVIAQEYLEVVQSFLNMVLVLQFKQHQFISKIQITNM